jgi:hypothetical protein
MQKPWIPACAGMTRIFRQAFKQQTANSKQQTANSKQQICKNNFITSSPAMGKP